MNDQISFVLKKLKTEKAKIATLIEKVQEARFTELQKELDEIAKTSSVSSPHSPKHSSGFDAYSKRGDVARHLNVSMRTVDNMMARKIIPYFKIGGMVRFKLEDIDRALEEKYRIHSAYEHRW